ncbi:MAG: AzlC family ABC transporter permease [Acetobacteraceae bacterium]|nr:AzlC family ABC transporter permease [Acetobacteraceae bacterium]
MTVIREAVREALGAPALAMAATFLAFGAAVQAAGLGLVWALAAAGLVYGMPGMMVLVGAGGALAAAPAAMAANARFLPMAVSLAPWLGPPGWRRWLALPFIAVTPWAMAIRRLPALPQAARLRWFLGFALASWTVAGLSTLLGFALAPLLPGWPLALLLLVNPLYFGVILAGESRRAFGLRAALAGMAAAPLVSVLPAAWGLLGAGLLGGTAAFLWGRRHG